MSQDPKEFVIMRTEATGKEGGKEMKNLPGETEHVTNI